MSGLGAGWPPVVGPFGRCVPAERVARGGEGVEVARASQDEDVPIALMPAWLLTMVAARGP